MTLQHTLATAAAAAALALATLPAGATALDANLIVNGAAESGSTSGWQAYDGTPLFAVAPYPDWALALPGPEDRGVYLFIGSDGSQAYTAGYQRFDLHDLASQIQAGQIGYSLTGWLGGWQEQNDNALVYLQFLDEAGAELGAAALGPVLAADRANQISLIYRDAAGVLPAGTVEMVLSLSMERRDGGDNDAYADNLALSLSAVPEPQTLALMGAGLLTLGRLRRRRAQAV